MSDTIPTKRQRRTKENVERDFFDAAIRIIQKVGFSGLTISSLTKEANTEPPVFYYRYKDINDFIDKFVRNYDYWLNDSINIDETKTATQNIEDIIANLIDPFLDNICMQKLIAWELNDDNLITRRTSQNRDNNSELLFRYFEKEFNNCNINFNAATAILIGGIYYLVIHRDMGTFNKINFSNKEGIDLLKTTIRQIIRNIFNVPINYDQTKEIEKNTIKIATELIRNNVDLGVIQSSTGLPKKALMSLKKELKK